jgi:hypothetical protein
VPEPEDDPGPPADEVVEGDDDMDELAEPQRYRGFRIALGRFAHSGTRDDARTALGRWAKKSMGGGSAGARRVARAARTGGAALAGLARAGAGEAPEGGSLDVRTLAGQPVEAAIGAIVDAFMPPGILDEIAARLAMEQALAEALGTADTFDPTAMDANAVRIATLAFIAELVFVQVAGDAGRSLAAVGPVAAARREGHHVAISSSVSCGRCVPCLIRRASFHAAGIIDQTGYWAEDLTQHTANEDVASARFAAEALAQ